MILDTGGHRRCSQLRRALTPRGTLVIVGGETGGRWLGGSDRQLRAPLLSPFTGQKLATLIARRTAGPARADGLIEAGKVTPVVDKTYPLSEAPEAIRYLRDGHARGKIVISL